MPMSLIVMITVGAAAGFLATRFMRLETNVVVTVLIGMAGGLLAWVVLQVLLMVLGLMVGFIGAVLGAMVLIWLWRTYGPRR